MISLEQEKNCALTSQERYDIINNALAAAEDNGFLNQFVFERALNCYEVLQLIEDLDDIDAPMVEENPLNAFDHFLEMGYLDQLANNHADTVNYVGRTAAIYFEDYEKYLLSLGGVINKAELLSSETLNNMGGQIASLMGNTDITDTLKIAEEWGMNRPRATAENPVDNKEVLDSLFVK